MAVKAAGTITEYLAEEIRLQQSTAELQESYRSARPFPHLLLQDLFTDVRLDGLVQEISTIEADGWVIHDDDRLSKANLRSAVDLREHGKQHVALLHSAEFLYMLSELTGVWGLVPDPYLAGGGYHVLSTGGLFDVHADRNVDQITGLTRRMVLITYLNRQWKPEYGGQLELWSTDASRCELAIEPGFNTSVLFEVADRNFHGVRPVQPPPGMSRQSFAAYFHTVGDGHGAISAPHHSVYAPSVYRRPLTLKRLAFEYVLPPGIGKVLRTMKALKDKSNPGQSTTN